MQFKERYTTTIRAEAGKTVLSDDAYAICEAITNLINVVRQKK